MPPTIWADWRLWIYTPASTEVIVGPTGPTGAGTIEQLKVAHPEAWLFSPSFAFCPSHAMRSCVQRL